MLYVLALLGGRVCVFDEREVVTCFGGTNFSSWLEGNGVRIV